MPGRAMVERDLAGGTNRALGVPKSSSHSFSMESIMNTRTQLSGAIKAASDAAIEVHDWREAERANNEAAEDIEASALLMVMAEKGEDKKPLYSNEGARQARIRLMLTSEGAEAETYRKSKAAAETCRRNRVGSQANLDAAERSFRVLLIEYEAELLGRRLTMPGQPE